MNRVVVHKFVSCNNLIVLRVFINDFEFQVEILVKTLNFMHRNQGF